MSSYKIDSAHSTAHFVVRHMMITNVRGGFSNVTGTVDWDPANPSAAKVDAVIDATTINTNEPARDTHLKSADFLDTEKFPTIAFANSKVKSFSDGEVELEGDLTIHGVT